jgi:hypothetical protein
VRITANKRHSRSGGRARQILGTMSILHHLADPRSPHPSNTFRTGTVRTSRGTRVQNVQRNVRNVSIRNMRRDRPKRLSKGTGTSFDPVHTSLGNTTPSPEVLMWLVLGNEAERCLHKTHWQSGCLQSRDFSLCISSIHSFISRRA